MKKIVDERQRRKQVKDARVQATLVRTKKLSDKAEKPPQPKRYNPRDASTKLAEFIHKFIYEKDKNTGTPLNSNNQHHNINIIIIYRYQ